MKLREALELSNRRLAYATFNVREHFFSGRVQAMGGVDGSIFIAEAGPDGKTRLGDMLPLHEIMEPMRSLIERFDCWLPREPKHPLQALAEASEDRTIDNLFHRLWTRAVGSDDYDKDAWMILQRFLEEHGSGTARIEAFRRS